jgi:hypothetical protein
MTGDESGEPTYPMGRAALPRRLYQPAAKAGKGNEWIS